MHWLKPKRYTHATSMPWIKGRSAQLGQLPLKRCMQGLAHLHLRQGHVHRAWTEHWGQAGYLPCTELSCCCMSGPPGPLLAEAAAMSYVSQSGRDCVWERVHACNCIRSGARSAFDQSVPGLGVSWVSAPEVAFIQLLVSPLSLSYRSTAGFTARAACDMKRCEARRARGRGMHGEAAGCHGHRPR